MEARVRTEKLASMGRMSAAVAHEIRNPLAAIAQANALLDEDLTDPGHKQLTQMVQQNALRLERIVDEVLDIARTHHEERGTADTLKLDELVTQTCRDWQAQTGSKNLLCLTQPEAATEVRFEPEHLRRVLINLLDNARRYASQSEAPFRCRPAKIPVGGLLSAFGATVNPWTNRLSGTCLSPSFRQKAAPVAWVFIFAGSCVSDTARPLLTGATPAIAMTAPLRATNFWCLFTVLRRETVATPSPTTR